MRGYTVVPFRGFAGGLNLRDAPDVVDETQALDCLNVVFTERGALKRRDGFGQLTTDPLTNRPDSLEAFYTTAGGKFLLAGCSTRLEALDAAGDVVDSETGLGGGTWDFARYGQPNSERAYAGNGIDTLRKFDGSTWTAPTATVDGVGAQAMPKAGLLAVDADENRLFATGYTTTTGGPDGVVSSPSHVYVSEPGDPETWLTTNSVQLRPGDGERIMGIVPFRDLIFVFKETCFFVFYGTSVDSTGGAIFNYRTVLGTGLAAPRAAVAGRDAVYFLGRDGVYRTEGGEAELLSALIEPVFVGAPNQYFNSEPLNQAQITKSAITYFDNRIYLAYPSGAATSNDRVLVFDPQYGWWSLFDLKASSFTRFRTDEVEELVFGFASGRNAVGRYDGRGTWEADNITRDDEGGRPVLARWRSGWFDFSDPNVKRIREMHLDGIGVFSVAVTTNWEAEANPDSTVVIDNSESQIEPRMVRGIATRGNVFSVLITSELKGDDQWADGTDSDDTWGGGILISPGGSDTTDLWEEGAGPSDWGDGTDPDYLWGDGTVTTDDPEYGGSEDDLWGPRPIPPFEVHRLESHIDSPRQPSVVQTEVS